MEKLKFSGKDKEELVQNIVDKTGLSLEDLYLVEDQSLNELTYAVYKKEDVVNEIETFLKNTLDNMGIEASFEIKRNKEQILIHMESNQSGILIGRNGQTLKALQSLIRAYIYKEIHLYPYVLLDVSHYQEKREKNLEKLAKQIAKEVQETKKEVIMDNMNSYERRIIHTYLAECSGIKTISEGIEPNRHIVVKPIEE